MQPEISHRCASCGASIREPAMFCPECGKALGPVANTAPDPTHQVAAATPSPALTTSASPEIVVDRAGQPAALQVEPAVEPASAPETAQADPPISKSQTGQPVETGPKPSPREKARERLHRASSVASSVARGALEDNVKRVEKIHHVSTAMIEEATYDPSLRFVLVALGLFVIFVILLVLNKVMG